MELFPPKKIPYESQKIIINSLELALDKRENCLVESSTGSGKTIALLCAAVNWQRKNLNKKIIYASRTHEQLKQVIHEFKTLNVKMLNTILIGKEKSCLKIGEDIKSCLECHHFQDRQYTDEMYDICDIEELTSKYIKKNMCTYQIVKGRVPFAEIIFTPYNFVLDIGAFQNLGIVADNCILILDEGHNIPKIAIDAYSLELKLHTINLFLKTNKDLNLICDFLQNILNAPGIFSCDTEDFIEDVCNNEWCIDIYNQAINFLKLDQQSIFLNIIKFIQLVNFANNYKEIGYDDYFTFSKNMYYIKCQCNSSSVAFKNLNFSSIILASGTLSPIDRFGNELDVEFKNIISVVSKERKVFVSQISKGLIDNYLDSTYTKRSVDYFKDVAIAISTIAKIIPNGILVFFPSYEFINNISLIPDLYIGHGKKIFKEQDLNKNYNGYMKVADESGAILLSVYRGVASEGMNFSDQYARSVICVGIPYPPNESNSNFETLENYAFVALNQAAGRCVRHNDDWGVLVFLDYRLALNKHDKLAPWISSKLRKHRNIRKASAAIENWLKLNVENFVEK